MFGCGCWFDNCCCCCFRVLLHNAGIIISTSDPRKGRFAACGPKSMCVDAGLFPYLVLDLVLDLVFFPLSSCSIQTRKRACFAFLFVGVNSIHEKRPVGNRRSNGIRSKTNRTMIVWSRLVKASVSNGERGFARSVPGQGSWRAF